MIRSNTRGHLGLAAFSFIANDPRLKNLPLILETPISIPTSSKKLEECPDIWRTEISVLNKLSEPETSSHAECLDSEACERLLLDIKSITGKEEASRNPEGTDQSAAAPAKRKKRKVKQVSEDGEDADDVDQ